MYGYWIQDRMVFFTISIIIVILAQITYAFWFSARYGEQLPMWGRVLLFFSVLPIAPFISFVFMCTVKNDTLCSRCINASGLRVADWGFDENDTPLKLWMKKKIARHFIFLQEAIFEAFPQCILQLIALVYYQEASFAVHDPFAIINIVSILISITSIASKSLIASANALNIKFVLYHWVFFCFDFFFIFFSVCWVFYEPITTSLVGQFYIYKVIAANGPLVLLWGTLFCAKIGWYLMNEYALQSDGPLLMKCCGLFCVTFFMLTLWFGGCCIAFMLSEILLFSIFPMYSLICEIILKKCYFSLANFRHPRPSK